MYEDRRESRDINNGVYDCYIKSPYSSVKHTTYFQVYEDLFSKYIGQEITFVEVGVLNGGSLFMWREYFGTRARIIGVDANPDALYWKDFGFEIYIGNQADPTFWKNFFSENAKVDVLLDDGGHTNEQQIVTLICSIPHIRDGGLIIVEDTHTSYLSEYANPAKFSFINFVKNGIDKINERFPKIESKKDSLFKNFVYSIQVYESIVAFHINYSKCFISSPTQNDGISMGFDTYTKHDTFAGKIQKFSGLSYFKPIKALSFLKGFKKWLVQFLFINSMRLRNKKLKKYFN